MTTDVKRLNAWMPQGAARALIVATLIQLCASLASQGVYIMVPLFQQGFEVGLGAAALAVTALNGGQFFAIYSLGKAIDRYGERTVVSATMVLMGLAAWLAAFLPVSFAGFLVLIFLMGVFYSSVQTGGAKAIIVWVPKEKRGFAAGLRQAAVPLGTALAAVILPWVALQHSWNAALAVQGAVAIAGGLIFFSLYQSRPAEAVQNPSPGGGRAEKLTLLQLVKVLGSRPRFMPLFCVGLFLSALQFTMLAHQLPFFTAALSFDPLMAANTITIVQIVGVLSRLGVPWAFDSFMPGQRIAPLAMISVAAGIVTLGFAGLEASDPMGLVMVLLVGFGVFGIAWFPLFQLAMAEIAPQDHIAATVGLVTAAGMAVISVAPFFFALIVHAYGYPAAWTCLAAGPVILGARLLIPFQPGR